MTSQAASLSAQKGPALMAGHDVTLTGAQNTSSLDEYHKSDRQQRDVIENHHNHA